LASLYSRPRLSGYHFSAMQVFSCQHRISVKEEANKAKPREAMEARSGFLGLLHC
jgi:hypothetical protein